MKKSGFTLVELLVVIAIIGILSTLTVIYLNTARMRGRDTRRVSDIKQLQLALKMYYQDHGIYPTAITAGSKLESGGTNYLLSVPSNPAPRGDNGCPDEDYMYSQLDDGQRYSLAFCLGNATDDLKAGPQTGTANGILACDDGYIPIPGSATFETNDFCVMKFEAKCVTYAAPTVGLNTPLSLYGSYANDITPCVTTKKVASVTTGRPIANISQSDARTLCENIDAHLMTNAEWMTIARNVEQVPANWSSGSVGSGYLYGDTVIAMDQDTYDQTSTSIQHESGFKLSTRQFIWKLGTGLAEWTDNTCIGGSGQEKYFSDSSNYEWNLADLNDYERAASGPSNLIWSNAQHVGEYVGCSSDGNGFTRGGPTDLNSVNGLYALDLSQSPTTEAYNVGFRCVK